MACDICGKTGTELADLMDCYKTKDIQQICPACELQVNDHLRKLKDLASKTNRTWLQQYMINMKNIFSD